MRSGRFQIRSDREEPACYEQGWGQDQLETDLRHMHWPCNMQAVVIRLGLTLPPMFNSVRPTEAGSSFLCAPNCLKPEASCSFITRPLSQPWLGDSGDEEGAPRAGVEMEGSTLDWLVWNPREGPVFVQFPQGSAICYGL